MTKVSVVIPNWNGRQLLEKNLPAVFTAQKNSKNHIKEIIIVDDGSTDDSVEYLKTLNKQIKLVRHKVNRGFSAAVNAGFRSSSADIVCLLNTDVVPKNDFLETVVLLFKDAKVFGVSLNEGKYSYASGDFEDGFIVHNSGSKTDKPHNTFWISGGSGVFNRKLWMNLGGLDEKLFSPFYWEDVDLSYRALKRGYKLLWEPKAKVDHKHESVININNFSAWKINLIKERNYLLFNWKNITSQNLFRKHIKGLIQRVYKHPGYIKVILAAGAKLPDVLRARNKEKAEQIVSDEAVLNSFK